MKLAAFEELEIGVLQCGNQVWISAHSQHGSVFGAQSEVPHFTEAGLADAPSRWLCDRVREGCTGVTATALKIGRLLCDCVFDHPEIIALLHRSRGTAAADGKRLLVRMLVAPHELSSLPWELMTDPEDHNGFLTLARDVHVVRSGRSRMYAVRRSPLSPPLRMLLIMSCPITSHEPFDLYAEKRNLLRELQPLVEKGLLEVVVEDRPSIERLRERIGKQRGGFHVVHYLGHASPTGFALESADGRERPVASGEFVALLRELPDLRLVVLAGCQTASAPEPATAETAWPGPLSAAETTVRHASPMVVGMQSVLPFTTERIFTRHFYQAVTAGQSVADALRHARLAISTDTFAGGDTLNWAVPTLLLGGSEPGQLLDPDVPVPAVRMPAPVRMRPHANQSELRFVSRYVPLRVAIDVLSARTNYRLLNVFGQHGAGKSAFLDRVCEELDAEIPSMFVSARMLATTPDPLAELARMAEELLRRAKRTPPTHEHLSTCDWWDALLEEFTTVPVAILIDEADIIEHEPGFRDGLLKIARRRTRARLALNTVCPLDAGPEIARVVQRINLQPLGWDDIWLWVRRNQPLLSRKGESALRRHFTVLPEPEQWEELAHRVAANSVLTFEELVELVAHGSENVTLAPVGADSACDDIYSGNLVITPPSETDSDAGARRLRVGIPPKIDAKEAARALTEYSIKHNIPGRVAAVGTGSSSAFAKVHVRSKDQLLDADIDICTVRFRDDGREEIGTRLRDGTELVPTEDAGALPGLGPSIDGGYARALTIAANVLVLWASDRSLSCADIVELIRKHGALASDGTPMYVRFINTAAALWELHGKDVLNALTSEPLGVTQIAADTGLSSSEVLTQLEDLETTLKVSKLETASGPRYQAMHRTE